MTDGGGGGPDGGNGPPDSDGSGSVSSPEKVVMAVSAAFTFGLFGFALWHAVAAAGAAPPTAAVIGSQPAPDGAVLYDVRLENPGDVGLVSATVSVECTEPPTELEFENVPAGGHRSGSIRCPPGTTEPAVTVSGWIQE